MEPDTCHNVAISNNVSLPIIEPIYPESNEGLTKNQRKVRIIFEGQEYGTVLVDTYFTPYLGEAERLKY